jgi:hypothetical protein
MSPLVLYALMLLVAVALTARYRRPLLTAALAALLVGPALYFVTGRELARVKGEGRFYSVPFGGDTVDDAAIVGSAAVWMVGAFVLAWLAVRPRARARRRE